jgi:hypothetical protein
MKSLQEIAGFFMGVIICQLATWLQLRYRLSKLYEGQDSDYALSSSLNILKWFHFSAKNPPNL